MAPFLLNEEKNDPYRELDYDTIVQEYPKLPSLPFLNQLALLARLEELEIEYLFLMT